MMIRRASGLILVAAAGLSPGSAQAGFYSGEALLESCTADRNAKDFFEKSYECVGYVAGAVDAFTQIALDRLLHARIGMHHIPPQIGVDGRRVRGVLNVAHHFFQPRIKS